ncbi:MAG TPA: archease [Nitrospirae bacterium]|nr:archease [Nitrospirota bacterium]
MNRGFEILDISGDAGLRVQGRSLEELFVKSALGVYSLITDLSTVEPADSADIKVNRESLDGLFVGWLNELIFRFDTYGFIGKEVRIKNINENGVEAGIRGEEFDPERHERGLLVKAATYHNLRIEEKNGIWTAEVVLDM